MASQHVIDWRQRTKQRIIEAMGGKCVCCGYNTHQSALELHHLDPITKQFTFGSVRASPMAWTRIVEELRKCILVCANCHREIEFGIRVIPSDAERFNESYTTYVHLRNRGSAVGLNKTCIGCGITFLSYRKTQKYCVELCKSVTINKRKTRWPDNIRSLIRIVKLIGYEAAGRKYGVSGTAVRKRIRKFGGMEVGIETESKAAL